MNALSPNATALAQMLDTPLAMYGLKATEVRMVAMALDAKGAVASEVLPEGVRETLLALARRDRP